MAEAIKETEEGVASLPPPPPAVKPNDMQIRPSFSRPFQIYQRLRLVDVL